MAEKDHSAECSVCFEEFEEIGDHVPRILPCSHTLCHNCIKVLLHGGLQIECPECKKQHPALDSEKSFPQNKYILENMRLRVRIARLGQADKNAEKRQPSKDNSASAKNDESCQDHG